MTTIAAWVKILTSHVSRLTSHVSRLTSHVSRLTSWRSTSIHKFQIHPEPSYARRIRAFSFEIKKNSVPGTRSAASSRHLIPVPEALEGPVSKPSVTSGLAIVSFSGSTRESVKDKIRHSGPRPGICKSCHPVPEPVEGPSECPKKRYVMQATPFGTTPKSAKLAKKYGGII